MRWKNRRRSSHVEDQRGRSHSSARMGAVGGGAASLLLRVLPMLMRSKDGRKILIVGGVLLAGAYFSGINLSGLLGGGTSQSVSGQNAAQSYQPNAAE